MSEEITNHNRSRGSFYGIIVQYPYYSELFINCRTFLPERHPVGSDLLSVVSSATGVKEELGAKGYFRLTCTLFDRVGKDNDFTYRHV